MTPVLHTAGIAGIDWRTDFGRHCELQINGMLHQLCHDDIVQGVEGFLLRRQFLVALVPAGVLTGAQLAVDEIAATQDRSDRVELG